MSSPITPIEAHAGPTTPRPTPDRHEARAFLSALSAGESTLPTAASRCEPPAEVLELVGAAGETHTELLEAGRELRFFSAAPAAPRIELHELDGSEMNELSIAEAFELVGGSSPE